MVCLRRSAARLDVGHVGYGTPFAFGVVEDLPLANLRRALMVCCKVLVLAAGRAVSVCWLARHSGLVKDDNVCYRLRSSSIAGCQTFVDSRGTGVLFAACP